MSTSFRVPLALLREQLDRLLRAVEARDGEAIEIDADYYWLLESREAFALDRPAIASAGQISDDIDELHNMAAREDDDLIPWHDLKHLIGLLEAIAARDRP